jgi:hypothetical protein
MNTSSNFVDVLSTTVDALADAFVKLAIVIVSDPVVP